MEESIHSAIQVLFYTLVESGTESFHGSSFQVEFVQCDIRSSSGCQPVRGADVVVMNPPFGTRSKGADMAFLQAAFGIAATSVYSLHKQSTRRHLEKFADR